MPEEINWDAIEDEVEMALPQTMEKVVEIFDYIGWVHVPGGATTLVQAQTNFSSHSRVDELQELVKEIVMDTLREAVETGS